VGEIGQNPKQQITENLDSQRIEPQSVSYTSENIAKDLFEIASEQRLNILLRLHEKKSTISALAKELEATVPEVFRNFERLSKAGVIEKYSDGTYGLTIYGKTLCIQIPSLVFISQHKKYFKNHNFGNLQTKFIQRIGSLASGQHIKGVVKIMEKWKEVYKNADKYIYNVLSEVPYTKDVIEELVSKLKKEIKVKSIFSESSIIPNERKEVMEKFHLKKYIDEEILERKMLKDVQVAVILNEKEACLLFPNQDSEVDMSEMLYSSEPQFLEWCLDYFQQCWMDSHTFQERILK
jgi:predicted transcriptional regulator